MQWLQESVVLQVYLADGPKIHHLLMLPFSLLSLAEQPFEAPRLLRVFLVHVTYGSLPFSLYLIPACYPQV